ncbi:MAG TPA: mandelate racemase/muconate lactonizing enzyme family protein [Gammaproteobacteria bacterium]|nr:mandelate racemase/muconate lactonizing enzyme family protein [Gammaproteobacteria bacterium]
MSFIQKTEIFPLSFPLEKPFSNHIQPITHIQGLAIKLHTDQALVGQGFIYGLSNIIPSNLIPHLKNILSQFFQDLQVKNAVQLLSHWKSYWHAYRKTNCLPPQLYALAVIDIAIWDLFTKEQQVSLHSFLGGHFSKIPAYGTTGWLSFSISELIAECEFYKEKGINAFKLRLGSPHDYARVSAIRAAMGEAFVLMLDANQRYSVEQAAALAKDLAVFNITWIEEPTANTLVAIEEFRKRSCLPIALGENIIEKSDFEVLCQKKLTDYLQLDLPRCAGITGFCEIAEIALQYEIPLCSHLMYELSLGLLAAFPNAYSLEYDHLLPTDIFEETFPVQDGYLFPSKQPGNGVNLSEEALRKYQTAFPS